MTKNNLIFASLLLFFCVSLTNAQTKWSNPINSKQNLVHGRAWGEENRENYNRLPQKAKEKVRDKVWSLSTESAGLSLVFKTNAKEIKVKYKVTGGHSMPHMPATGVSGVDLYAINGESQYWCEGDFSFGSDSIYYTYKNLRPNTIDGKDNLFQLYLPLYNNLKGIEIGVPENDSFEFVSQTNEKPIVVYGTSITQGACASRPGMAWTNILSRKLSFPLINLGFSGNGQLEKELFELMTEIDAELYIIDCMPNMTKERTELIQDRLVNGVELLRKHSKAPILLVEHGGYMGFQMNDLIKSNYEQTNIELQKAYNELIRKGVSNIYYLSHTQLGLSTDSQVDGTHPSDLGMQQYADAYEKEVKSILKISK